MASTFLNKKITLIGLGAYGYGSGISAAEFLARSGAALTITDLKSAADLTLPMADLKKSLGLALFKKIRWVLGRHDERDCVNADLIVRNPDVPWYSSYLECARRHKVPVHNDVTIFLEELLRRGGSLEQVIGVTGTRGKTTTTHLIYEMVRQVTLSARIGGNVGVSPLRFFDEVRPADPIVLELSSFLLHDLETVRMSPHISVVTNIFPDHLNKYRGMKDYIDDKKRIFRYQKSDDAVILNWDNLETRKMAREARVKVIWFSVKRPVLGAYVRDGWFYYKDGGGARRVAQVKDMKLLGEHNISNICAAIAAAEAYGVPTQKIATVIKKFRGVPYRLELVRVLKGVRWYNDSTATSPEAAMAALRSFPAKKIILITGGNSKGTSLRALAQVMRERARVLIRVPGNANRDLPVGEDLHFGGRRGEPKVFDVKDLREAVWRAAREARKGEIVLLSPGLTWLPLINEFARGGLFKELVKKIK